MVWVSDRLHAWLKQRNMLVPFIGPDIMFHEKLTRAEVEANKATAKRKHVGESSEEAEVEKAPVAPSAPARASSEPPASQGAVPKPLPGANKNKEGPFKKSKVEAGSGGAEGGGSGGSGKPAATPPPPKESVPDQQNLPFKVTLVKPKSDAKKHRAGKKHKKLPPKN